MLALWCPGNAMALENITHRLVGNAMSEIGERPPLSDRSPRTDCLAPCARSDPRSSSQPAAAQRIAARPIHQTCAPPAYETSAGKMQNDGSGEKVALYDSRSRGLSKPKDLGGYLLYDRGSTGAQIIDESVGRGVKAGTPFSRWSGKGRQPIRFQLTCYKVARPAGFLRRVRQCPCL